jgi:hypothetical protein
LEEGDEFYDLGKELLPSMSIVSRVVSLHEVWPGE